MQLFATFWYVIKDGKKRRISAAEANAETKEEKKEPVAAVVVKEELPSCLNEINSTDQLELAKIMFKRLNPGRESLQKIFTRLIQEKCKDVVYGTVKDAEKDWDLSNEMVIATGKAGILREAVWRRKPEQGKWVIKSTPLTTTRDAQEAELAIGVLMGQAGIGPRLVDAGPHFFIMERLPGKTVERYIQEGKYDRALDRAIQTAIQKMHSFNVYHRDIHPENLMMLPDQQVKIIDFASAQLLDEPISEGEKYRDTHYVGRPKL